MHSSDNLGSAAPGAPNSVAPSVPVHARFAPFTVLDETLDRHRADVERLEADSPDGQPAARGLRVLATNVLRFILKRNAKHLRTHLSNAHQVDISQGQALDAIAASWGAADWNVANAGLGKLIGRFIPNRTPVVKTAEWAKPAARAFKPKALALAFANPAASGAQTFDGRTLVIGCAGSGKTVGTLLAMQRVLHGLRAEGRPVLFISAKSGDFQPSPEGIESFLARRGGHVDLGSLLDAASHTSVEQVNWDQVQAVTYVTSDFLRSSASELAIKQREAAQACLTVAQAWIAAGKQPVVVIDEPFALLGSDGLKTLLEQLPEQASLTLLVQTHRDLAGIRLKAPFKRLLLLRSYSHSVDDLVRPLAGSASECAELREAVASLTLGECISIELPQERSQP